MRVVVNRSITRSIVDQLPRQGGGQLPPFKGALTARHPRLLKTAAAADPVLHPALSHHKTISRPNRSK